MIFKVRIYLVISSYNSYFCVSFARLIAIEFIESCDTRVLRNP